MEKPRLILDDESKPEEILIRDPLWVSGQIELRRTKRGDCRWGIEVRGFGQFKGMALWFSRNVNATVGFDDEGENIIVFTEAK